MLLLQNNGVDDVSLTRTASKRITFKTPTFSLFVGVFPELYYTEHRGSGALPFSSGIGETGGDSLWVLQL